MIHHLKKQNIKRKAMKLQELTSKAGVNVKQMSKTVKKTVYPDYYFSFF